MLVAVFAFAAISLLIVGILLIVGRERFAQNVPPGSGLPKTAGGVLALGCLSLASAALFVIMLFARIGPLIHQDEQVRNAIAAPGTGPKILGILLIVIALSLVLPVILVWQHVRRARKNLGSDSAPYSPRRRIVYAGVSVVAGIAIAMVAFGLSVLWLS